MQKNYRSIVLANTVTLIVMLFANFLGGSGVMVKTSVGEISNKYDTLFTPAGYAFSIWSIIFLLLISFCVYQWSLLQKGNPKKVISRMGYWLALSNMANSLWLVCWLNEWTGLSVLVIILLLICLCVLTVRLRLELDDEPVKIILFVWWPVTIYLGWIMVATIACVAAWLVSTGYSGGSIGEETWTIIMITIATALYLFLIWQRNLREAALVGIWAFVAIAVKQWQLNNSIAITAIIASFVLFIAISIHAYRNREYNILAKLSKRQNG
jgi:hypothetical protein